MDMEENIREKEVYRKKIIEAVETIDRIDVLEYLLFFINNKFKVG